MDSNIVNSSSPSDPPDLGQTHAAAAAQALDKNCWSDWPGWECYAANVAGLISTALWFIVLLPQVLKNWYRRSVVGLSFLWAVANFTASLVNLFYAFSIRVPLYVRVSAVYMPILEITILVQFLIYSHKPLTRRLLACLVCLLVWGCIIELELNLPESKDKIQWVAIALWSIETFPQVVLNIKRQSTSGQSTISVMITLCGKTTDFLVTYGLHMPLPYVVMCYFSSSSSFINGFQLLWYRKDNWFSIQQPSYQGERKKADSSWSVTEVDDEHSKLLPEELQDEKELRVTTNQINNWRNWFVSTVRMLIMTYVAVGLIVFAIGFFWRTRSFFALLGPVVCLLIIFTASEYYNLQRKGRLRRCEERAQQIEERLLTCGFGQEDQRPSESDRHAVQ